jgi:quercetin dioxygenase-like cupin family protein
MSDQQQFFFTAPQTTRKAGSNTTRAILGHDHTLMMLKMDFEKGAIGEVHHHIHTQATYVLSGSFEFTIGDKKEVIHQGDACFMPANISHGCICLEAGSLLDVFTPERDDFL